MMTPPRILLVLVECDGAEEAIPLVLDRAAGVHPITALQVLDPAYRERLCRRLRQEGWMGASHSQTVTESIDDVYRARFDTSFDAVVDALTQAGLSVSRRSIEGDLVNATLSAIDQLGDVGRVLVVQPQRSWLRRWFKDLNVRALMDRAPCPVELIELRD